MNAAGERARLAQVRRWLRQCVEVCVYSEFGFVQVHKKTAAKLLRKFGGQVCGRYCDVFDCLFLEQLPF
jgi:hypothetical protein